MGARQDLVMESIPVIILSTTLRIIPSISAGTVYTVHMVQYRAVTDGTAQGHQIHGKESIHTVFSLFQCVIPTYVDCCAVLNCTLPLTVNLVSGYRAWAEIPSPR